MELGSVEARQISMQVVFVATFALSIIIEIEIQAQYGLMVRDRPPAGQVNDKIIKHRQ